jgi:2-polyprenyl-3-methyl-5-hydroxy-6-metoxy-1,4-benzoquinol methylase
VGVLKTKFQIKLKMIYSKLEPLIKKSGSKLTPEKFQEAINVIYHDIEANYYDSIHRDMWESLQEQIDLLVKDLFENIKVIPGELTLLDIGCGTGLSTQILLNSKIGNKIDNVTLLDTSKNMLNHAEEKAKKWNKKYTVTNSQVSDLKDKFDIILICSVLHHIPDLNNFLDHVNNHLNSGGILIHLQDPNGDYQYDPIFLNRVKEYESKSKLIPQKRKISHFIPLKWRSFLNRQFGRGTLIDLVNDKMLVNKVISNRMTADEIWSVTDIHVINKQNIAADGISMEFLQKQLHSFKLIKQRSYGFYGPLKSDLTEEYKKYEDEYILRNELNGRNVSGIWIKN